MTDLLVDPWTIPETEYPRDGSTSEKLRFFIRYALLAPSTHNTQPWQFHLEGDKLVLLADRRRELSVIDPDNRELVMSVGASLFFLRLAIRHFGHEAYWSVCPNADDPDRLAVLHLGARRAATPEEEWMFAAMPVRHTNRLASSERKLPPALVAALKDAAREEKAFLRFVEGLELREQVADLVAEGDRVLFARPAFREELTSWLRSAGDSHDGMPGAAFGVPEFMRPLGAAILKDFDTGWIYSARDRRMAAHAPALVVISTDFDSPRAWMAAGQALARVLLRAGAEEIWASYFNQPIQVPELRTRLREMLGLEGQPQVILRLGRGRPTPHTPRRPLEEVLV